MLSMRGTLGVENTGAALSFVSEAEPGDPIVCARIFSGHNAIKSTSTIVNLHYNAKVLCARITKQYGTDASGSSRSK